MSFSFYFDLLLLLQLVFIPSSSFFSFLNLLSFLSFLFLLFFPRIVTVIGCRFGLGFWVGCVLLPGFSYFGMFDP